MSRGRKVDPRQQLERLEGDAESKRRVAVLLEVLAGRSTINAAASELGISETQVFELKQRVLKGALGALRPQPVGRPPRPEPEEETRQLAQRITELEEELELSMVRTEIALVMPHLLKGASSRRRKKP